jgi:hypothetical protein
MSELNVILDGHPAQSWFCQLLRERNDAEVVFRQAQLRLDRAILAYDLAVTPTRLPEVLEAVNNPAGFLHSVTMIQDCLRREAALAAVQAAFSVKEVMPVGSVRTKLCECGAAIRALATRCNTCQRKARWGNERAR